MEKIEKRRDTKDSTFIVGSVNMRNITINKQYSSTELAHSDSDLNPFEQSELPAICPGQCLQSVAQLVNMLQEEWTNTQSTVLGVLIVKSLFQVVW